MKQWNHGVIGMGAVSRDHINGILPLPGMRVAAIYDRTPAVLEQAGDRLGIADNMRFRDYRTMLESPAVDSVSICTPNFLHYEMVRQAIQSGKPFAVEKPLSLTTEQAEELTALAEQAALPHILCFSYRFMPVARYARWIVQNGYLGELRHVCVQYHQGWGSDPHKPLTWRFQKELCGYGALGDLGSHVIDLVRFLAGEIEEISADCGTFIPERARLDGSGTGAVTVDDYAQFMARLAGGIPALFSVTRFAYGRRNYQRVELYGSKGGLIYTQDLLHDTLCDKLETCIGDVAFQSNHYSETPVPVSFQCSQMEAFYRRLNGDESGLAAGLRDGLVCQRVMDAVARSAASRQWERVK